MLPVDPTGPKSAAINLLAEDFGALSGSVTEEMVPPA